MVSEVKQNSSACYSVLLFLCLLFLQAFIIFGFALDIPPRQNANKFGIALGLTVSLRNRKLYGYELYDTSKLER